MGFLLGFVGGAADAAKELALNEVKNKASREMAEAEAVRRQALAEYQEGRADARAVEQRTFLTSEREDKQTFESGEKDLDRKSAERTAAARKTSSAKPVKIGEDDMGAPIYGVYNAETGELEPVNIAGAEAAAEYREPTAAEMERARVELNTAGGKDRANDWIPFNEPSRDQVYARALENRRGGGGQGATGGKPAAAPSFDDYAAKVRAANAGADIPEAELRAKYEQKFGKAPAKAPKSGTITGRAPEQDATPKQKDEKPDPKPAKQPKPEKTPDQRLADIEERLRADQELKEPGSGGIVTRAIKARQFPLGVLERKQLEEERDRLRKELGAAK